MSGPSDPKAPDVDDLSRTGRKRPERTQLGVGAGLLVAVVLLLGGIGIGWEVAKSMSGNGTSSGSPSGGATTYTISETGSSLIYPLMSLWAPNYTALNPSVTVTPASTGSGTGISSAEAGTVSIGGTDAYLAPATATSDNLLNVPVAISSQLIFYNLPGISAHLHLNGTVLAMIYSGKITQWNDPLIAAANPGANLPSQTIVPLHRSDGSGDTFMFSSLCYLSWKGWTAGYGTTVSWIPSSPGYNGNAGMVTGLSHTQYGIAYIGISYLSEAEAAGLGYAALGDQAANENGTSPANYILPTPQNISEDANLGLLNLQPPSMAVSLILGGVPGATDLTLGGGGTLPSALYPTPYPDTNLEYLLISTHPSNPALQKQVVQFIEWGLSYGNGPVYMEAVHFLPLTAGVAGYDMQALASVEIAA